MPRTDQLVGRAAELETLDRALAELERRRPGALALLGDPGIGKTRLLAELAERAERRRCLVLAGSASELERELPFGIFVDALDDYVQAVDPRLDDETRAELAHVLPSLPAAGAGAALRDERYRTHQAVRRLLEGLAASQPLVLVLDDLHWADSGALELIGALLRRPPAAPVLLARDLVRPTDVPRRFRFRHPLVRAAVYAAAPGGWRLGAHERCSAALAAGSASAPARAHHVEQAARRGDAAAIAVLREAGEAVAQHAPAGAARWFAAALRLLPDTAPAHERVALLAARAGALAAVGRFAEAHAALMDSLALVPPEALDERVQLIAACAGLEQLLGRHAEAHARLVAALGDLADPASPQAASLMITLALDAFFRMSYEDSLAWGVRALDVARPLGGRPLTAAAAAVLALAASCNSATEQGERHRAEAAALVDAMPDDELAQRLDAVAVLCGAECYLDRYPEANAHGTRGLALARATGQGELLPMLIPALQTTTLAFGRLAESAELLDGAIEGARLAHNDPTLAWYLFNRSLVALLAGDLAVALAAAEEAAELARPLGASFVTAYVGVAEAVALWESGEPARGIDVATAKAGRSSSCCPARGAPTSSTTSCAPGSPSAAPRRPRGASQPRRRSRRPPGCAWPYPWPGAPRRRSPWTRAMPGSRRRGRPSPPPWTTRSGCAWTPLARLLAGRALARVGEAEGAVAALRQAAAELDACGARRFRDQAERGLGRLGRRTPRRSRAGRSDETGVGSLTARELEVARLLVDRRTNAEIAAELFLSQKTVETHIRNLFHKLDVSSRVEVARLVERQSRI